MKRKKKGKKGKSSIPLPRVWQWMRVMSGTLSIESEAASASVVAGKHLLNKARGKSQKEQNKLLHYPSTPVLCQWNSNPAQPQTSFWHFRSWECQADRFPSLLLQSAAIYLVSENGSPVTKQRPSASAIDQGLPWSAACGWMLLGIQTKRSQSHFWQKPWHSGYQFKAVKESRTVSWARFPPKSSGELQAINEAISRGWQGRAASPGILSQLQERNNARLLKLSLAWKTLFQRHGKGGERDYHWNSLPKLSWEALSLCHIQVTSWPANLLLY